MIIITREMAAKKFGVMRNAAVDVKPVFPVTTAIVEMEGANDNVNIQFKEIAMNGSPGKTKPKIRQLLITGPMFLLIHT